jgi:hypothetical protein
MSVLISNCHEINKSCTNSSRTKQLFSFSQAKRFDTVTSTNNSIIGDAKEIKSKYRGASMGYGDRYDYFSKNTKNKADKFYLVKGDFEYTEKGNNKNSGNPAYSFGRKILNENKLYDKNVKFNYSPTHPGPGTYNMDYYNSEKNPNPKYSLNGRNFIYAKKGLIPGSGAYNVNELNCDGKYILSKNGNIAQTNFGKHKCPRFKDVVKQLATPGPGSYNIKPSVGNVMKQNLLPKLNTYSGFRNDFLEASKSFFIIFNFF